MAVQIDLKKYGAVLDDFWDDADTPMVLIALEFFAACAPWNFGQNLESSFRADWRVVYIIDDAARVVSVTRIARRREVYG